MLSCAPARRSRGDLGCRPDVISDRSWERMEETLRLGSLDPLQLPHDRGSGVGGPVAQTATQVHFLVPALAGNRRDQVRAHRGIPAALPDRLSPQTRVCLGGNASPDAGPEGSWFSTGPPTTLDPSPRLSRGNFRRSAESCRETGGGT